MIYSKFCEKEFEILFCREFLNKYSCCDFYFPSQRKEVKKGFDARFKNKKFKAKIFQFKVVFEYCKNPFGHLVKSFGFETHKVNGQQKQHNALVKLNNRGLSAGYAVPCFIERNSLIDYARHDKLIDNCLHLIPIKPLSAGNHRIKFDTTPFAQQFCNQAENMKISKLFSLEYSEVISYNNICESLEYNKAGGLFEMLSSYNLFMYYELLD